LLSVVAVAAADIAVAAAVVVESYTFPVSSYCRARTLSLLVLVA
jgi:hypothetical protein